MRYYFLLLLSNINELAKKASVQSLKIASAKFSHCLIIKARASGWSIVVEYPTIHPDVQGSNPYNYEEKCLRLLKRGADPIKKILGVILLTLLVN